MKRRGRPAWSIATVALAALAACTTALPAPTSSPAYLGDLASETFEIFGLDPAVVDSVVATEEVFMVYEPLFRFDTVSGRPVPGAARELPTVSADGLRYRVTLRDGLTYSDRVPVRAQDFAYSLSRLCDPKLGASYAATVSLIAGCAEWLAMAPTDPLEMLAAGRRRLLSEGLRVLSDRELEIVIRQRAPYFVSVLGLWFAVPVRQTDVERGGERWSTDPATYVGNGPFVLEEFTAGTRMVFVRNARARVPAKLGSWTKHIVPDRRQTLERYRARSLDIGKLNPANLAEVEADPVLRADLRTIPTDCSYYLRLNTVVPPLDDVNVRLALAKSLDRETYVRTVRPLAQPATSLIPPGLPGHDAGDTAQQFDPIEARALLARSRYGSTDVTLSFGLLAGAAPNAPPKRTAQWAVAQWKKNLGIEVGVLELPRAQWVVSQRSAKTTSQVVLAGWCGDYPDQHNWLSALFS
ncbi:MAG: peptide ABC transporter substrate-binding protein, partial [Chloroflexota bacterium]